MTEPDPVIAVVTVIGEPERRTRAELRLGRGRGGRHRRRREHRQEAATTRAAGEIRGSRRCVTAGDSHTPAAELDPGAA